MKGAATALAEPQTTTAINVGKQEGKVSNVY
jgi:hypothetical protein